MGRKGVISRMFKYKYALIIQDVSAKYKVWKLRQARVIEGWVCKNEIKGLSWFLQVPESIRPYHAHLVHLQLPADLLYKFKA